MLGGKQGAGIVALDRDTGREVWRALDEAVTWSSPIVINAGGVRQLIVWTQQSVSSLNPANGKLYWREATSTGGSPGTAGVSTPVFQNGYLLVSGWMFQLEKDRPGGKTLWPEGKGVSRRILSDTSTGLLLGDYVYSAKAGGDFLCLKAATGEEIWKTSAVTDLINGASIHETMHGDSAFLFNDRGELIQARLAPGGYEEISRTKLIEPTSPFGSRKVAWAAPAFAHHNVYARNDQELIAFRWRRIRTELPNVENRGWDIQLVPGFGHASGAPNWCALRKRTGVLERPGADVGWDKLPDLG